MTDLDKLAKSQRSMTFYSIGEILRFKERSVLRNHLKGQNDENGQNLGWTLTAIPYPLLTAQAISAGQHKETNGADAIPD